MKFAIFPLLLPLLKKWLPLLSLAEWSHYELFALIIFSCSVTGLVKFLLPEFSNRSNPVAERLWKGTIFLPRKMISHFCLSIYCWKDDYYCKLLAEHLTRVLIYGFRGLNLRLNKNMIHAQNVGQRSVILIGCFLSILI